MTFEQGEIIQSKGVDIDELRRVEKANQDYQREMQDQFALLLGVDSESLRGLKTCRACGGIDHQWTNICFSNLAEEFNDSSMTSEDYQQYRTDAADSCCQACEGMGFEGGREYLATEEWIALSQEGLV